jgi:hypothetical protein
VTLPTISLTEAQAFTAFRAFLLGVVAPDTEVIRAQVNRVPEPRGADFVLMSPLRQARLATNETTYADNVVVGSITGAVLTVSQVIRGDLPPGALLIDSSWPTMNVQPGTIVGVRLTGTVGGSGAFAVSPSQTLGSETLYAGVRMDDAPTEWVVQLDVHGPTSADNSRVIESLFRSEYATQALEDTGFAVTPLYCDDPREVPFLNTEQQYEFRWSIDCHFQVQQVIGTPQDFATEIEVETILANALPV